MPASCPSDTKLLKGTLRHLDWCNLFVIQTLSMTCRETPRTVSDSDSSSRPLATIKRRPSAMAFGSTHQPTAYKSSTTPPINHIPQHHQTSTHHNHNYTLLYLQHITPTKCVSPRTSQSTPFAPRKTVIPLSPPKLLEPFTANHPPNIPSSTSIPTTPPSPAAISLFKRDQPPRWTRSQHWQVEGTFVMHATLRGS
jgi:hypothetical protein